MADIFLSYSSKDRERVEPLARALADAGFTLWWDGDLRPGADFAETIEHEIKAAKAVIVAWTRSSAHSQWVRDEATYGRNERKLVPLLLDRAEPPMGFGQIQSIDFRHWSGDPAAPEFVRLRAAIAGIVGGAGESLALPRRSAWGKAKSIFIRQRLALLCAGLLAAGAATTYAVINSAVAPDSRTIAMGSVEIRLFSAIPDDPERRARASSYTDAFRHGLTELGVPNQSATATVDVRAPEIILTGEVTRNGDKEVLTAHFGDRRSGATLWSLRGEPSDGAAAEANLASFALKCALKRRDPKHGVDYFSRFINASAFALLGDWQAEQSAARALYEAAPQDANAIAYFARANMSAGWAGSTSSGEHKRFVSEGKRLAEAALRLNPKSTDALLALVFTYKDTQFEEQEKLLRAAIEADPEHGFALGRYANLLTTVGRIDEAIDFYGRAQLHRPHATTLYPRLLASRGYFNDAANELVRMRPLDPIFIDRGEIEISVFYGDIDAASRKLAEHPELGGELLACERAVLAVRRKEFVDASRLAEFCGDAGSLSARVFALAGDFDQAIRAIDTELQTNEGRHVQQLFWPETRGLVRDPLFWPRAAKLGLVDYWLDTDQWPDFCAERDLAFDCKERAAQTRAAVTSKGPADP